MLKPSARYTSCRKVYLIFIMLYFLVLHMHEGSGQDIGKTVTLPVTAYNVEEGLDQSTVYQVSQDSNGLVWLISGGGLQYFDGEEFRSFCLPDELSSDPSGNTISGLVETGPNQMAISTVSSVINFNSINGRFRIIEQRDRQFPRIFKDSFEGKPLCWLSSDGLYLVGNDRLYPVRLKFPTGSIMPQEFSPSGTAKTTRGSLLLVEEQGFLELSTNKPENQQDWEAVWIPFPSACSGMACGDDGEVYFLLEGIIYSYGENGVLKEEVNTGIRHSNYLFRSHSGDFWLSDINGKGVYRISDRKTEEIRFITCEGNYTDTLNPAVRAICEDKSGNLWFGTDGNGLLFYSPARLVFDLSRTGFTRCISYYKDEIWAGTFKNGLWRLPVDLSGKSRVNPGILTDELYFFDLIADTAGRLWAATNKGIYVLDSKGGVVFYHSLNTTAANFLSIPGGDILLSTYGELYSCETGLHPGVTFIREQTQVKKFTVHKGCCWVGNHFGLFRKDTASAVLTLLYFHEKDRLSSVPVYSLLPMGDSVWVGTESGIECYSPGGEKIPYPPSLGSLKHEIVYSLLQDAQNRIWFATSKGAGCILPGRDRIIRFSVSNNLQSTEFNFNASLEISQERIFFGGINGINGLNTDDFIIKDASPDIRLISLNISDSAYSNGIPPGNVSVEISWRSPHFSGTVFTPAYLPAGTAQFSFLLEGYQDSWSQLSYNSAFTYRNLLPGRYLLWAKCTDSFQNQGPVKRLLEITIRPPFWKTWWFIAFAALLMISSIVLIIRKVQEAKYRNKLIDLEKRLAIDRERLRISQDMHDEIGSSLTQIAILSEIVKKKNNDQGEVMKLIERISGISGTVVDDLGEIIWAMNPKNDDLPSFLAYLREHASGYLSSAEIEGSFSFPEECPQLPMTSEQRRNIFLVVKEALHNVVKHSGAYRVNVSLNLSGNLLSVIIDDNGTGFEVDKITGTGNGLPGMQRRIEALGGSYSITSNKGKGTLIQFSVSIPPLHLERGRG
jgi:signal transduction histidine kinase